MDDADLFLDDDLGDIPDNTLLELEQNAISSTQKPPSTSRKPATGPVQRLRQAHNASSLTRTRAGNTPWRPPQQRLPAQAPKATPNGHPDPPSQQNEYDDESVINLADEPLQSQNLPRRPAAPTSTRPSNSIDAETAAAYAAADAELFGRPARPVSEAAMITNGDGDGDIASLQARIAALEADNERARDAEMQAQKRLETKAGEITIVRANLEKERKEHDRRLTALQQEYAVQAAKHRAEVEAGRKEREKMQTDNRFLQHDLAQEAERAKRLTGPGRLRSAQPEKETPKRAVRYGFHGDGFDHNEVLNVSPSRSKERQKDATPRVGSKRKRSAADSPIPALSFAKPSPAARHEAIEHVQHQSDSVASPIMTTNTAEGDRLKFMQYLLAYQPWGGTERAFELLIKHKLPSLPHQSLSAVVMDDLSFANTASGLSIQMQLAQVLCKVWSKCLNEQHFEPINLIVDLICFAISLELPSQFHQLAAELVPLCLKSLEIVTLPVVRASLGKSYAAALDKAQQDKLTTQIDARLVTDLLWQLCQACTLSPEQIDLFWRLVDFTNSMLLIHKALPMDRVMAGMDILSTSALDNSFGAIHSDPTLQEKQENDGIYRLTFALFDIPSVPIDEFAYTNAEIAQFRISLLSLFQKMCQTEHNCKTLTCHPHFIGKLIRFIEEQISKLYALPPSHLQFPIGGPDPADHTPDARDLVVKTINMAVRILYRLLTSIDETFHLGEKLNVVIGGYHKFLIGMTRIAFAEQGSVFEYGLDEEVIDAAHAILDQWLTPDDGEAIAQALETPQGTRGMSAKKGATRAAQSDSMDVDFSAAPD